jgi:hypothetical protein
MNARRFPSNESVPKDGRADPGSPPVPVAELAAVPPRHLHRQRDFGIGYGNSSGYGSELHYIDGHVDPIFRCV